MAGGRAGDLGWRGWTSEEREGGRDGWQQAHHTLPTLESVIASRPSSMGMSAFHHPASAPTAKCRGRAEFRPSGGDKMA